jgi:AraC-like DNA-binding protein
MEGEQPAHTMERVLPDGCVELILNLRDDMIRDYDPRDPLKFETRGGSILCGPHSEFMVIDTEAQGAVMGIHFQPGGAWPFLGGTPARELLNQTLSLEDVWGTSARELRQCIVHASSHANRFRILESALMERLRPDRDRHPAVAWSVVEIERARPARTLSAITNEIGISSRRFIELFSREVGLTPKRYHRIRRFQRVVQTVHRKREVHWADLAVTCGYFDQAHFIHDFKDFCGLTPEAYFAHRNLRHANHIPLPL